VLYLRRLKYHLAPMRNCLVSCALPHDIQSVFLTRTVFSRPFCARPRVLNPAFGRADKGMRAKVHNPKKRYQGQKVSRTPHIQIWTSKFLTFHSGDKKGEKKVTGRFFQYFF